jgi:GntP family gluconate:H+ symporter
MDHAYPFVVLGIGILVVLGGIIVRRVNAFLALLAAALVVSFMAGMPAGSAADPVARVAITAGGVATHALVPPTPGPLFVANALGVELGVILSLLPIVLPIILIAGDAVGLLGSAGIALLTLWKYRRPDSEPIPRVVEQGLMSAGVIILITSAGGAFGAMLREAGLGEAIRGMIITSGMVMAMVHPAYVAQAIGAGALVASWMNDSGFWIFARMGGLTESQTLRSWTPVLTIVGTVASAATVVLAVLFPMAG